MIAIPPGVRVYLSLAPADMRKGSGDVEAGPILRRAVRVPRQAR